MEITKSQKITNALLFLRPNAQFVLRGDDYANIEWLDNEQTKPTLAEVEAKILELPQIQAKAKAKKATARQALLAQLGITEEQAKLLLS